MHLMMPLTGFSLLMASCSTVPRPDTTLCVNNVPLLQQHCRNLKTDYDDNGEIKPGSKPTIIKFVDEAAMLAALNKTTSTTPTGLGNLKAYVRSIRDDAARRGD